MVKAYREEREMKTKNGVKSITFDNFECFELRVEGYGLELWMQPSNLWISIHQLVLCLDAETTIRIYNGLALTMLGPPPFSINSCLHQFF